MERIDATSLQPIYAKVQQAWTMGLDKSISPVPSKRLITVFYSSPENYELCQRHQGMSIADRVHAGYAKPVAFTDKRLTRSYKRYIINNVVRRLEWLRSLRDCLEEVKK